MPDGRSSLFLGIEGKAYGVVTVEEGAVLVLEDECGEGDLGCGLGNAHGERYKENSADNCAKKKDQDLCFLMFGHDAI